MLDKTLRTLFAHKSWANTELFAVLASLSVEHSEQRRACLRALNHIYIVDRIFRAHLAGEQRLFDATSSEETPDSEILKSAVTEIDSWYQRYIDQFDPNTLSELVHFTFTNGYPGCMSREEILLHIITHGVFHRGNVAQILKSISVAPPNDPYTVFLHQAEPDRCAYGVD